MPIKCDCWPAQLYCCPLFRRVGHQYIIVILLRIVDYRLHLGHTTIVTGSSFTIEFVCVRKHNTNDLMPSLSISCNFFQVTAAKVQTHLMYGGARKKNLHCDSSKPHHLLLILQRLPISLDLMRQVLALTHKLSKHSHIFVTNIH